MLRCLGDNDMTEITHYETVIKRDDLWNANWKGWVQHCVNQIKYTYLLMLSLLSLHPKAVSIYNEIIRW